MGTKDKKTWIDQVIKKIISLNMLALVATYSSLFYQTTIDVERLAVDTIEKDEVIAEEHLSNFLSMEKFRL